MIAISKATVAVVATVMLVDAFALFLGLDVVLARRARRLTPGGGRGPEPVTRREFLRRFLASSLMVFGAQFGAATIAFLWPDVVGSFGSLLTAGRAADIKGQIADTGQPFYSGPGRFYLVGYDGTPSGAIDYGGDGLTADGLMALYQRCVHLGCRVPFCESSQWFECPCHQSKYNAAREYKSGPAARGLDRFRIRIDGDLVLVDTAEIVQGPPRGTDTNGQSAAGPFCVASA